MSLKGSSDNPIRVLVVEDSPTVREFLVQVLSADPGLRVVGTAADGQQAIEMVEGAAPDVVTMDIHMPRLNGLDATRLIMERHPVPIVIVSANVPHAEAAESFRAIEAGAVTVMPRPAGLGSADMEKSARHLIRTVRLMAEVKVVRRWPKGSTQPLPVSRAPAVAGGRARSSGIELVAIAGSTGAPVPIKTILSRLPRDFSAPIVIVQHITPNFIVGFADWLHGASHRKVEVAVDGARMAPGCVYVAPDFRQLGVQLPMNLAVADAPPEHGVKPSASYLFRSVAETFGSRAAGVILSGMGHDGVDGMRVLQERGGYTIAQDAATSVVHSMPRSAIEAGAVAAVLPPEGIADALIQLVAR